MENPIPSARRIAPAFFCCTLVAVFVTSAQAAMTNRWSFSNTAGAAPSTTVIADSVGTSPGVVVGINATSTGTALTLPGTTTGNFTPATIAAYVDLPDGIISSKTNLTVEIWATPVTVKYWQRLFDFGRLQSGNNLSTNDRGPGASAGEIVPGATGAPASVASFDDLSLAINQANTANTQRLMARNEAATELGINTTATVSAGTQYHFVCTFTDGAGTYGSAGGLVAWYRNGTLVTSLSVNFHLSAISDFNNWLGRSMYTDDNQANISYNEMRLYNHVLTATEIAADYIAGPDTIPSGPVSAPIPDNLWAFTGQAQAETPSGRTFTDSIGGMVATLRGNGGSFSGSAVVLPGSTTGNQTASLISAYLDLPNGAIQSPTTQSVTFEAWATPVSSKSWARLFDFGRCTTANTHGTGAATGEILDDATAPGVYAAYDNLSLTFNNVANMNSQQLEGQNDGGTAQATFTTANTTAGTQYHYVFVVEDTATGCQVRWYRDGLLQNTANFTFNLNDITDVNNWIGRSMYGGDSCSNMSLNELRIYRRAITPAEITASKDAGPDPAPGTPEPPVPAPIPTRRWNFNATAGGATSGATAAGTQFLDAATSEIATVRGNGATLTNSLLALSGPTAGTSTIGNTAAATISSYLDLPNGIISSRPSMTVEAWITPLSSKNWQRVFDFGNSSITYGTNAAAGEIVDGAAAPGGYVANDNLFLSVNNAGTFGSHRLAAKLDGGAETGVNTDYSSVTSANTQYHFVMTVKDGGGASGATGCLVKWYRNGTLGGTVDLPYRLTDMQDVNNWIGRSMWGADNNSNMSIDELRLYDRAISIAEVNSSRTAGPNPTFAPPVANADSVTIHPNQKALIDVMANDTGEPVVASLLIASQPAVGTVSVSGGKILYTHSGSSASPVTFTYSIRNVSGSTVTGTVTINFATSLRLTNTALAMPAAPPATAWQLVDALAGLTFTRPICMASLPADTKQLYVCEQSGVIKRVADVTALTPTTNVFLDLTTLGTGFNIGPLLAGQPENGLLGLAFHPNYATNGYFYVAYTILVNGTYYQRVSRFTRSAANPTIANTTSELVLLNITDFGLNHNGGDLHFGPTDGYLYYGTGDGDNSTLGQQRSQKINGDFYSGMFRMDVDKKPGSLAPNSHASIPTDSGVARFNVPPDNPFVHTSLGGTWNGTYVGQTGAVDYSASLATIRTEFWATGIRHCWRFSFDPENGDLWEGDVGQDHHEEVNKIEKGVNYGWAFREGANTFTGILGAAPTGFTSRNPVYEYTHSGDAGDPLYQGKSICGGYVYRGSRYPSLFGKYIFSDSYSGHVWQMDRTTGETIRLTGLPAAYGVFSAQGVDPSNNDLLFCAYLTGKIMRLTTGDSSASDFPTTLSATGLFSDLTDLSPAPGLLPYKPNLTFWSDYAVKQRWFSIPDAAGMMTWSKDGNWTYPTGMLWVKHFDMEMSRGNALTKKRLETRVLVKTDDGMYGVSYRWNDAGTEATLVPDAGVAFDLAIDDHGTPHTQHWEIPARTSCLTCHNAPAGRALSFNTRQLNSSNTINGYVGNQLELLSAHGFFNNAPAPASTLPRHVGPKETAYPLEERARSYFAVNCSYCHQAGGSVGYWDGRPQLSLEQTGLINGVAQNNKGDAQKKYIVPGRPDLSIVLHRMAVTNNLGGDPFSRMPPLATNEIDPDDIEMITNWINTSLLNHPLYQQWRDGFFDPLDPNGDKNADPDGDGVTNYEEYLRGGSPLGGPNGLQPVVANGLLQFTRKAHRYYSIQKSTDLANWETWSNPQLETNYSSTDAPTQLTMPAAPGGNQYFRFRLTEP